MAMVPTVDTSRKVTTTHGSLDGLGRAGEGAAPSLFKALSSSDSCCKVRPSKSFGCVWWRPTRYSIEVAANVQSTRKEQRGRVRGQHAKILKR